MTKKIKVIIYFILSVLFISPSGSDENLNEYEINFYSGMFDFSDDGQRAALFGFEHQNENLVRDSFLGKISPVTGFMLTENSAAYAYTGIQAQYNLGIFFEKGYGLQKDLNKAKEWYRLAADQGLESAVEKLKTLEEKQNVEVRLENNIDFAESEQQSSETTQVKSSNKLNLTNWLREQAPNQYIIQLVSVVTEKAVINFLEKETFNNDRVGYVEVTVNGITRYAAIYGLYDSYENAKTAISALPPSMNTKPWVRKIEIIKKILN